MCRQTDHPRGFTLIELLVSTVILIFVSGIMVSILVRTQTGVKRGQETMAMNEMARGVITEVSNLLATGVPPSALDKPLARKETVAFRPGLLAILTSLHYETEGLARAVIESRKTEGDTFETVVTLATLEGKNEELRKYGDGRFSVRTQFQYATTVDKNLNAELARKPEKDQTPVLVRVRVTVTDTQGELPQIEQVAEMALGRISGKGGTNAGLS